MAGPNAHFAPLIILCVLCYFRRAFLRSTGLRHSALPHIWSTGSPPKHSLPPPRIFTYTLLHPHMIISECLVVPVTLTCPPPHPTNLLLVHPSVFSSATPRSTKAIGVSS
jgi:hypothetical protein